MSDPLARLIERLKQDIPSFTVSEAAIKQGIVLPILGHLGWDTANVQEEVVPEYSTGKGRVDYCLNSGRRSRVFIEAKGLVEDLEGHQEQLLRYSFEEGIELSVLTNGRSWWLYLPTLPGHWEQRKFYAIDLEKQEVQEITKNLRELLSKDAVATSSALQRAKALHEGKERERKINQALPEAWDRLFSEPNEILMELLADTVERLCGHKPESERVTKFLKTEALQPPSPLATMPPISPSPRKPRSKREKDDFTGKKFLGFKFGNVEKSLEHNYELIIGVSEALNMKHPEEFPSIVLSLAPFSRDPNKLKRPVLVPNTDIYVEKNRGNNYLVTHCRKKLLPLFGYSPTDLKINLR